MNNINGTSFSEIYNSFLSKVTDDMYMELSEVETFELLQELLLSAIPWFEFPRINLSNYECEYVNEETTYCGVESDNVEVPAYILAGGAFSTNLTREEINILSTYMVVEWLSQQLATIENVRLKYSGSDFKFTSQANHLHKVLQLKKDYEQEGFHLQRLYKRRKVNENGIYESTMKQFRESED